MKKIKIELVKIVIDEKRQDQIIFLKEKKGDRCFPIVIGFPEAISIKMRLAGDKSPRPMAHDLLVSVIDAVDAEVKYLLIDYMNMGTFFAKLVLKTQDGTKKVVDCRPSDGIAISTLLGVDIFTTDEILEKTAVSLSD